jgi:uncharacterized protein (DUF433 family)
MANTEDFVSYDFNPDSKHFPKIAAGWDKLYEQRKDWDCITARAYVPSHVEKDRAKKRTLKEQSKEIAMELCEKYNLIGCSDDVFHGKPRLKDTRFTVADVLSAICVHSSLEDVLATYEGRYTEQQFKDAIRYARDFILKSLSTK